MSSNNDTHSSGYKFGFIICYLGLIATFSYVNHYIYKIKLRGIENDMFKAINDKVINDKSIDIMTLTEKLSFVESSFSSYFWHVFAYFIFTIPILISLVIHFLYIIMNMIN
jgi:hypothetical protein